MIRKAFFWILLAAIVGVWAFGDRLFPPELITAKSATITDGDTLVVSRTTFRLYGIDAPEYRQTCKDAREIDWGCGKTARTELARLAKSGEITCEPRAEDKYGRKVAKCGNEAVPDFAQAMAEAGLAISPAERGSAPYEAEQDSARRAKRGIWQGTFDDPVNWRTSHPRTAAQPK